MQSVLFPADAGNGPLLSSVFLCPHQMDHMTVFQKTQFEHIPKSLQVDTYILVMRV